MNTYIIILRGINVSGHRKIPMAELREQLGHIGLECIQSYIQSGNLVVKSSLSRDQLSASVADGILKHFGFEVPVLVLTSTELSSIIDKNPFSHGDSAKLHVTFLAHTPAKDKLNTLPPSPNPQDQYVVKDQAVYVYCAGGYGRTKINNNFFEKTLEVTATTRNWRTCLKLSEMAQST